MKYALIIVLIYITTLMITKPSREDVVKCMKTTNYSHDRCIHELMR